MLNMLNNFTSLVSFFVQSNFFDYFFLPIFCISLVIVTIKLIFVFAAGY